MVLGEHLSKAYSTIVMHLYLLLLINPCLTGASSWFQMATRHCKLPDDERQFRCKWTKNWFPDIFWLDTYIAQYLDNHVGFLKTLFWYCLYITAQELYTQTMCWWILLWSDTTILYHRADSKLAPSPQETLLQSNAISHWLGAYQESVLS